MTMSDVRSTEGTRSAEAQPPPRIPGTPLLGHLRAFRSDRTAVQLRTARSHPDVAMMRMGVFDLCLVSSPHLAHDILQDFLNDGRYVQYNVDYFNLNPEVA